MAIAAVDIALLALRWLWYEQYITAGGAVLQVRTGCTQGALFRTL